MRYSHSIGNIYLTGLGIALSDRRQNSFQLSGTHPIVHKTDETLFEFDQFIMDKIQIVQAFSPIPNGNYFYSSSA